MAENVAIVVPCFNEEKSLARVVAALNPLGTIFVVDDASTDDSRKLAKSLRCTLIEHAGNRGYVKALETGVFAARDQKFDLIVTVDGDGQHDVRDVSRVIEALREGHDVVVPFRLNLQRFSEHVFAAFGRFVIGVRDPLCGLKGYRRHVLENKLVFERWDSIGSELAMSAVQNGASIAQFPIRTLSRIGVSRFGSGFRANFRILRAVFFSVRGYATRWRRPGYQ